MPKKKSKEKKKGKKKKAVFKSKYPELHRTIKAGIPMKRKYYPLSKKAEKQALKEGEHIPEITSEIEVTDEMVSDFLEQRLSSRSAAEEVGIPPRTMREKFKRFINIQLNACNDKKNILKRMYYINQDNRFDFNDERSIMHGIFKVYPNPIAPADDPNNYIQIKEYGKRKFNLTNIIEIDTKCACKNGIQLNYIDPITAQMIGTIPKKCVWEPVKSGKSLTLDVGEKNFGKGKCCARQMKLQDLSDHHNAQTSTDIILRNKIKLYFDIGEEPDWNDIFKMMGAKPRHEPSDIPLEDWEIAILQDPRDIRGKPTWGKEESIIGWKAMREDPVEGAYDIRTRLPLPHQRMMPIEEEIIYSDIPGKLIRKKVPYHSRLGRHVSDIPFPSKSSGITRVRTAAGEPIIEEEVEYIPWLKGMPEKELIREYTPVTEPIPEYGEFTTGLEVKELRAYKVFITNKQLARWGMVQDMRLIKPSKYTPDPEKYLPLRQYTDHLLDSDVSLAEEIAPSEGKGLIIMRDVEKEVREAKKIMPRTKIISETMSRYDKLKGKRTKIE